MIHVNWWGGGGVSDRLVVWLHCRCLTRSGTPLLDPRAHSPVLVSSADMLHATKRTLQMKHTWTNSISLLFRTLNILAMIVFLDGPAASSCSILRALFGGLISCMRPWKKLPLEFLTQSSFPERRWRERLVSAAGVENRTEQGNDRAVKFRFGNPNQFLNSDSVKGWVLVSWQRASCPEEHFFLSFFSPSSRPVSVLHKMRQCPARSAESLSCAESQIPRTCAR